MHLEQDFVRTTCPRDAALSDKFRFNTGSKSFLQQFAKLYETRLKLTTKHLKAAVLKNWGSDLPTRKVCDVVTGERCILLGTTFKQMKLQPSILNELSDELNLPPQQVMDNYTSEDDILYLEDMVQRIALVGDIKTEEFVTGVSIAVRGAEDESNPGHFCVEDICYPEMFSSQQSHSEEDSDVLFVSGLEFGGSNCNQMALRLLADYVSGSVNNQQEASRISRIIIAGDSVSHQVYDKEQHYKAKYLTKSAVAGTVDAVKDLNSYLKLLTKTIPVTIMPGEYDPSNCTMPQQPLHPCMLADESGHLETATNPYECEMNGVHILGHSGQPCNNIKKYSKVESSVEVLKRCLTWCHMAPTAPDTLGSYPYADTDPFIMKKCPRVFFAGNQSQLEADYFTQGDNRCLCLAIPKFSETGFCVKVNLKTLDWEPISLSTDVDC